MENVTVVQNGDENHEVVLRDLQSLLLESIGKDVQVVESTTSLLLPKGENYASTMLKVEALIKRTKSSPEEKLHLVAKMIPSSEFQRSIFNSSVSFAKEIYVIQTLAPMYKQLEREVGLEEDEIIDIFPKIYAGRLSRNEETPDVADEDAVMLLENLKVRGYDTMNRMKGLDFEHAVIAITQLARYHALGMALRHKKPKEFAEAQKIIDNFPFDMTDIKQFEDVIDHTIEVVCSDQRLVQYEQKIRGLITEQNGFESFMEIEKIEPWISINHGDFWVNNIMFQHDDEGKVKDIKFVDFQIALVCSPLKDLPYFLCASTSTNVMKNQFDELLDAYHAKLVQELDKLGVDSSPFTKESFEKSLMLAGKKSLFQCLMAVKFFTLEVDQELDLNNMKDQVMMAKPSDLYKERVYMIVKKFAEKGWL
ncbi:uncharacterized protein LOC100116463 [Nasonia vitripennis]|uniref:CHK kinase-like domain-containing protein n=1 Tax=Nasonia vitripennis TaxID=7425 RepID=A0A7M7Q6H6_NASVI|nr:uncharacterized protein LOC100116463 [Nasonia vitripennis]